MTGLTETEILGMVHVFSDLILDMADVTLGYATRNDDVTNAFLTGAQVTDPTDDLTNMYVNIGGEFSGWNVNILYLTNSVADDAAYGIDLSGGSWVLLVMLH